ncbi:MFS transporter [Thalassospiraceae bacterium LMO-SO8]|nr:MFS transporter [Alphaproteobacteria bacterium LMO-S08]WND75092.1 MFS transporter [Thalassospiraceae bacterium LMO-SO8]
MLAIFLIVVVDLIGFGIIIPLLPFYGEHFQADPQTVGLLMATYSLAQFISAPLWGRLSDHAGRRPVLLLSLAGAAAAYVWLAFADALWMLFMARTLGGLMAGNISAAFAYMADITTKENRAKGMGMIGAAFGIGFILGPAIGGILAGPDPLTADYRSPALAAAGLSLLALLLGLVKLPESLSAEVRARAAAMPRRRRLAQFADALRLPGVGLLMLLGFLATFVFAGLETTFAMWSRRAFDWGPEQNGWLFAYVGLLSAAVQGGLMGRLAKRFGERALLIQGAVALALGIGAIPFCTEVWHLLAAMAVAAYGFSVINPAYNSLISQQVPDTDQGGVMGVTRSVTTLARVLGPAWAGLLFAQIGRDWPYYSGALVMAAVLLLALAVPAGLRPAPSSQTDGDPR